MKKTEIGMEAKFTALINEVFTEGELVPATSHKLADLLKENRPSADQISWVSKRIFAKSKEVIVTSPNPNVVIDKLHMVMEMTSRISHRFQMIATLEVSGMQPQPKVHYALFFPGTFTFGSDR